MSADRYGVAHADYVSQLLYTDTIVYEVVGRTAKTLKLRRTRDAGLAKREHRGGNPWPCDWDWQEPDETAEVRTMRLRKDGTYRMGAGGWPLKPCPEIDGRPVRFTDYRE